MASVSAGTPAPAFDPDMERTAALTGFLFTPPKARMLLWILLVELAGFGLWGYDGLPGFRFPLVLAALAAAGALAGRPLARAAGGDILFSNALFLALALAFVLGILLEIGAPPAPSMGFAFGIGSLVFATLAGLRTLTAGIPAAAMIAGAYLAWVWSSPRSAPGPAPLLVSLALAWAMEGTFFAAIGRPLGRLGVDFLDVFARVLGDYSGGKPSAVDPFASSGVETEVLCQTIVIERGGTRDAVLIPWIHPGPLPSLGGNLPDLLRASLGDAFRRTIFLHSYVDHSRNPAGVEAAVAAVAAAARRAADREAAPDAARPFLRASAGAASATGLRMGGFDLIVTTFAPEKTDDLSPEAGERILSPSAGDAVLVDGHNSLGPVEGKSPSLAADDPRVGELAAAVGALRGMLEAEASGPLEVGISERAVGAAGIGRSSALAFRVSGRTSVLAVLDSNNLPAGFREEILAALESPPVEIAEVATSDAHPADIPAATRNFWKGSGRTAVLDAVRESAREALEDLKPARVRFGSERIAIRTWGPLFERIVRAVPRTARFALIAGVGLILIYWALSAAVLGRLP